MNLHEWEQGGDYLELNDGRVFFRVAGEGEPLLLLHGFPTSSWDFQAIWPTLAKRYRVITYDKLGFGFSDKPRQGDYTIGAHLQRTWAVLSALGITKVRILAHDVGNTITQALASASIRRAGACSTHTRVLAQWRTVSRSAPYAPLTASVAHPFGCLGGALKQCKTLRKGHGRSVWAQYTADASRAVRLLDVNVSPAGPALAS